MNQEITNQDFVIKELAKFNPITANVAKVRDKYMKIEVKDSKDLMNYDLAKVAHREIVTTRTGIEKLRVELKASSLEFGRKVDAEAKKWKAAAKEIEDHLMKQRKVVEDELERIQKEKDDAIKDEEERKRREEEARIEKIRQEQEAKERELVEKEERLAQEEEERQRKWDEDQARITEEQEAKERKLQEERDKVEAEKQAIEDEKARIEVEKIEKLHQARRDIAFPYRKFWKSSNYCFGTMSQTNFESIMEDLKESKASHEELLEKQRIKDEKDRIAAEKAETERLEALKPDIEKIHLLALGIRSLTMPDVQSNDAFVIIDTAKCDLLRIAKYLEDAEL